LDRNVIQKEIETKLKYENISIEMLGMCNMKCFVIPVTAGITNIWKKIPENHSTDSVRTTAGHRT
jgi:hypothetical protein